MSVVLQNVSKIGFQSKRFITIERTQLDGSKKWCMFHAVGMWNHVTQEKNNISMY